MPEAESAVCPISSQVQAWSSTDASNRAKHSSSMSARETWSFFAHSVSESRRKGTETKSNINI